MYPAVGDATPQNDKGLKLVLAQKCAEHVEQFLGCRAGGLDKGAGKEEVKWVRVLEVDRRMAFEVLRCLAQRLEWSDSGKQRFRRGTYFCA